MKLSKRIKIAWQEIAEGDVCKISKSARHLQRQEIVRAVLVLAAHYARQVGEYSSEQLAKLFTFVHAQMDDEPFPQYQVFFEEQQRLGAQPLVKISCELLVKITPADSRMAIMRLLLSVATQPGHWGLREQEILQQFARYLQLSTNDWETLLSEVEVKTPFQYLNISPTDSPQKIKAAYRKAVLKYHPDKTKLPAHLAAQKFREVQQAYEQLMAGLT